mmetsp:Transcript_27588/g.72926  ORF Transcript_27588/g.72926 Transcript_27588/m.72926 type:complete len:775 (-) Transcript_27588:35-2359(-)
MGRGQQARAAVCLLSVALLLLQCGLYAQRGAAYISIADHQPVSSAEPAHVSSVAEGAPTIRISEPALDAARFLSQANASGNSSGASHAAKDCGGQSTDFPRNRILIVHEQHLQSMGCDVRLLRFIKDLLYLNQEVSMLFRGTTPAKMRQPKSKQLASILHISDFEEDQLRKGLRQPPGLYEWTNAERFAQLMALGYFNMVIIFLWFWYDPQPSVAELVLPLIRAHAPADKQPFVSLLCDDAHAIRSLRLGEVEIHPSTRDGYNDRARNYMVRQKNMYQLVDMVMHISPMDQVAEKESFPFVEYYKLLRMPIRAFRILNKNMPAPMQDRSFLSTANIGFIGNGLTPTNHLGIQWYLENCWEDVRRQLPGVRMRLIGRPPGERMVKGVTMPCVKTEDPHCGWAWGTMYSGAEAENGIDELGYLSAEGLLEEVLSWRLMIVPVLRTTGVNTKILVALELGVPLVITPVAASPFDLPENETIVAFADQALDFVQQTVYVYTVSWLWTQLSRASRQHWENLATHDPARNDVRTVLTTVCEDTTASHYLSQWDAPQVGGEPKTPSVSLPPSCPAGSASKNGRCALTPPGSNSCLQPSGNSTGEPPPLMIVASHSLHQMFPSFTWYMTQIWQDVCRYCHFKCSRRAVGARYVLRDAHLLMDEHMALPLSALDNLPYRLVLYSWDPGKMGRFFHYDSALLETIGATERIVAQTLQRPGTSLTVRINQEMRSGGGFLYCWRKVLGHLGLTKPAISKLIQNEIGKYEGNWTKDLIAHMMMYKAG